MKLYAFAKKEQLFMSCQRGIVLDGALACVHGDVPHGAQLCLDKLLSEPCIVTAGMTDLASVMARLSQRRGWGLAAWVPDEALSRCSRLVVPCL